MTLVFPLPLAVTLSPSRGDAPPAIECAIVSDPERAGVDEADASTCPGRGVFVARGAGVDAPAALL
ncbi:uncharacterized protein TRAVEDRAFT_30495 [Trametes versicolor FP-101664 SS1]|uniref:uncharacterized protein n=1 Tax=Trametes versicolor (strain FP-101664) TaxID=717944 RepID=UPI0004623D4A|nr:uncharacterized protein TRAVEDRAFT_30495 [Trametes versicolor FP-101664 SS1]EIW55766.1 hypothetical protein TRAVEDRAFT_30495 [Trametes versicolor FP-101664 SS1]